MTRHGVAAKAAAKAGAPLACGCPGTNARAIARAYACGSFHQAFIGYVLFSTRADGEGRRLYGGAAKFEADGRVFQTSVRLDMVGEEQTL